MSDPAAPLLFEAILRPYRSLGPRGFRLLMLAVLLVSLGFGSLMYAIGAWPVVGFLGVDVAILYLAFRINFRRARAYEALRLTPADLTIERVSPAGVCDQTRLSPYWLRIDLHAPDDSPSRLRLWSHGQSVPVGDFLPTVEKSRLADDLGQALDRLRNPRFA